MRKDAELKQIARDLYSGQIFCDRHIKVPADFARVFMILNLMRPEDRLKFSERDIGLVYEYLHKAAPLTCNGLPCFFSLQTLTKAETEKTFEYCEKLENALEDEPQENTKEATKENG